MKTVLTKTVKVFIALMIPATFMISCSDDSVEPIAGKPGKIKVPQQYGK